MAPLPPSRARADATAPRDGNSDPHNTDVVSCSFCLGISVYTKAMADRRLPPRCDGLEIQTQRSRKYMDDVEQHAGKMRSDNFEFYGLGLSTYSPARMTQTPRLPAVRGVGVVVLKGDPDAFMKRMEERKRVQRELEERDEKGEEEDDDELVEDLGDEPVDDGMGLMEKGPLGSMPKAPRMPPMLPTMTFEEFVGKGVENSKTMVRAMYNFWAKRLDGFGDRYQQSCHRIVVQMQKQIRQVPQSIAWMKKKAKELDEQVRRGGGGGGVPGSGGDGRP